MLNSMRELYNMQTVFNVFRKQLKTDYAGRADIKYYTAIDAGEGGTANDIGMEYPLAVKIGVGGLFSSNNCWRIDSSADWSDLVGVIVTGFHECRHVEMHDKIFNDDSLEMRYFAMAHLSQRHNVNHMLHNWSKFVTEVDAERFGVHNAAAFLSAAVGENRAEELLLSYINKRVQYSDYVLPIPDTGRLYTSMDDVFDAFDKAYEESKHSYRDCRMFRNREFPYQYLYGNLSDTYQNRLLSERDGYKQDAMFASIVLTRYPSYQYQYASLRDMNLSIDATFSREWMNDKFVSSVKHSPVCSCVRPKTIGLRDVESVIDTNEQHKFVFE